MKIGIDGRCLQDGKNTGVEEYARGLIKQLLKENKNDEFVIFLNAFGKIKEDFSWLDNFENVEFKRFKYPNKFFNLCFWFLSWPKVDKLLKGVDVFVSPNFHFIALTKKCRRILTVHDLSFERIPETFSWKRRFWHFLINPRKSVEKADLIWPVSNSTAQDLIGIYGVDRKKIVVNYPFFNFNFFNQSKNSKREIEKKYDLPEKFILFLGTIEPRKNIEGLILGFGEFKKRNRWAQDYKLVIAGEKGWLWQSILQKASNSEFFEDIIFTGFLEEEDKPRLYSLATVFVYPSFYEGFGFPPLEAMASGTPTIASNCSSMPEILSDGAILINPYKPFEITLALELFLKNKNIYQIYSLKGKKQAQKISKIKRSFRIK